VAILVTLGFRIYTRRQDHVLPAWLSPWQATPPDMGQRLAATALPMGRQTQSFALLVQTSPVGE